MPCRHVPGAAPPNPPDLPRALAPYAPPSPRRSDYKEAERLKLAHAIGVAAADWTKKHPGGAKFAVLDLGVDGPMDFWRMGDAERREWLDDGLHLTQQVRAGAGPGARVAGRRGVGTEFGRQRAHLCHAPAALSGPRHTGR